MKRTGSAGSVGNAATRFADRLRRMSTVRSMAGGGLQQRTQDDVTSFFLQNPPETSADFRNLYSSAMECYLGGEEGKDADWIRATGLVEACLLLRPADGPSLSLRAFLASHSAEGRKPEFWKGFRELDSV
mmetsp:Transcript_73625/g.153655  ORF Transcript_73625/g.153655 Transcript_73625/m.153655 type:complete len:130 (+) Transcript_73625:2-391(+)